MTITNSTIIYVNPSGNDNSGDGTQGNPFATPQKAIDSLNEEWISPLVSVQILCSDGVFYSPLPITVAHPCGDRIIITGENSYLRTMTSIQSSSGSSGAWAITINLNDITNIAVNDFVIISSPSGGTKTTYIAGVHPITAVDTVNNRITISSKHQSTIAPSGAIGATVNIIKTVFRNDETNIVRVEKGNRLGSIKNCILNGTDNSEIGMYVTQRSLVLVDEGFGIYGADGGVFVDNGSVLQAMAPMAISNISGHCYQADDHSALIVPYAIASGITEENCYAFFATYCSQIECTNSISTGGTNIGIIITTNASARAVNAVVTGFTKGFHAGRYGYIYAVNASVADCATAFSPAPNTVGNEGGYIDT